MQHGWVTALCSSDASVTPWDKYCTVNPKKPWDTGELSGNIPKRVWHALSCRVERLRGIQSEKSRTPR